MNSTRTLLAAIVVLWASAGCSTIEVVKKPMPFRVAIAPATIQILRPEETPEFVLQFTERAVTEALSKVLKEDVSFVEIMLLEVPAVSEADADTTPSRMELARLAREISADLLLEPYLESGPAIQHRINEKFWLNLPLFALGGPFCYWVSDRRYDFEVNMTLIATSLSTVPDYGSASDVDLDRNAVFPRPIGERLQQLDLNFADRSGFQWSSVLASLVVPAGLLSKTGDTVRRALEERILATVSERLVEQLRGRESELIRLRHLVPFYVDPDTVALTRTGGSVELKCIVILDRDKGVDFLEGYTIRLGDTTVEKPFSDPTIDGNLSRYEIRETVALGPTSKLGALRLEVRDASMDENARSYTFAFASSRK